MAFHALHVLANHEALPKLFFKFRMLFNDILDDLSYFCEFSKTLFFKLFQGLTSVFIYLLSLLFI